LRESLQHGATLPPRGFLRNGASGTRTRDLLGAIQALSQLSYSPALPGHARAARARIQSPRRSQRRRNSRCGQRHALARPLTEIDESQSRLGVMSSARHAPRSSRSTTRAGISRATRCFARGPDPARGGAPGGPAGSIRRTDRGRRRGAVPSQGSRQELFPAGRSERTALVGGGRAGRTGGAANIASTRR
jgi:hypothetical protein